MKYSLGGALAVRVAHKKLVPSLIGMVVIDVVEGNTLLNVFYDTLPWKQVVYHLDVVTVTGTALEALSSMQCLLRSRPKIFKSFEQAAEWW
jgi:acyl dehydratase